jgi:L-histidine N-alpha-methyltransferase
MLDCAEPGVVLRYVPVDVDEDTVRHAAAGLVRDYPLLDVYAVAGDFEQHLSLLPPRRGRRLVTFFGSTIGNLHPPARQRFLSEVRHLLGPEDRFLVGLDLVKPLSLLEAAYNDALGVTAEFNRNVLRVVNRGLGANFDPQAFRHEARFDARHSRIDMFLVAEEPQAVHVRALNLRLRLEAGEAIWTESSYKFTRARATSMLAAAGMVLERWLTDYEGRFALALAAPV